MSNTTAATSQQNETSTDPNVKNLSDDVRMIGRDIKTQASSAKDTVVTSAKILAADTKEVAHAKLDAAMELLREKSREFSEATEAQLESTRQRVTDEPLKAIAIAAGVGFFLGRFIFNGR